MLARDLAEDYPLVQADEDALVAARMMAERRHAGLVVVDRDQSPLAILGAAQLLRCVLPGYVLDDPALARVLGEQIADRIVGHLSGTTVRDLLDRAGRELPVVNVDDTVLELAALLASTRVPLAAVVEAGRVVGVVTASRVLAVALGSE